MIITDLHPTEYDPPTQYYLDLLPYENFYQLMEKKLKEHCHFLQSIPEDRADFRYAANKWSTRDVLQHLNDNKRVYTYRALRFARNDKTEIPGYEVNDFAYAAQASSRSLADLVREFEIISKGTQLLFESFDAEMLQRKGIASGYSISVRAIGFKLIGHDIHHCNIIQERYL